MHQPERYLLPETKGILQHDGRGIQKIQTDPNCTHEDHVVSPRNWSKLLAMHASMPEAVSASTLHFRSPRVQVSTVITLASTIVAKSYIGKVEYFFSQKLDLSGDALSSTKDASNFSYGLGVSCKSSFPLVTKASSQQPVDRFQQPNIQLFAELLAKTFLRTLVVTRCKRVAAHSPRRWGPTSVVEVKTRCCNLQSEFISYTVNESSKNKICMGLQCTMVCFQGYAIESIELAKPPKWLYRSFAVNPNAKSLSAKLSSPWHWHLPVEGHLHSKGFLKMVAWSVPGCRILIFIIFTDDNLCVPSHFRCLQLWEIRYFRAIGAHDEKSPESSLWQVIQNRTNIQEWTWRIFHDIYKTIYRTWFRTVFVLFGAGAECLLSGHIHQSLAAIICPLDHHSRPLEKFRLSSSSALSQGRLPYSFATCERILALSKFLRILFAILGSLYRDLFFF